MLRVLPFRPDKVALVPAVVHEDGTGRVQTLTPDSGRLYDLLMRFKSRTGVPILLNTSFNVADEPIVETPADALWSLLEVDLDFCVLVDTLVTRAEGYRSLLELVPAMPGHQYRVFRRCADGRLASHRSGGELVEFDDSPPWGPQVRTVTPPQLAVLQHVAGKRTGWEVLEVINAQPASNMSAAWLLKTLALLRRLGIISLSESG